MTTNRMKDCPPSPEAALAPEPERAADTPAGDGLTPAADVFVVGIGASAGGLAALEAFFSGVPAHTRPGMAFVVVQHQEAGRKSLLADLIQRHAHLPVRIIGDGTPVGVDTVHVAPPDAGIAIDRGVFRLTEQTRGHGHQSAIDRCFRSLAYALRERAFGVVLSGAGADGAAGAEAIKAHGGMVLVQAPETAEFQGMPRSALATGLADDVLPPAQMYARIQAYAALAMARPAPAAGGEEDDAALREVFALVRGQLGHDFSQYKPGTILRRLRRRLDVHQVPTLAGYVQVLRERPEEVTALFRDLLIGVTGFFRDAEVFRFLETRILPELVQAKGPKEGIRLWVAGCATGEEAYSLAMLLAEQQDRQRFRGPIQILATDLDDRAVAVARAGVYPATVAAEMSPERLARFFTVEADGTRYRVKKSLREMLVFSEHDLLKAPPFSRLDLVSCRNLLIYLDAELQHRVSALFHYALVHGGLLLLGASESVGDASPFFTPVDRTVRLYRRRDGGAGASLAPLGRFQSRLPEPRLARRPEERPAAILPADVRSVTERAILQATPTAILLNAQGDVLHVHGRAGLYLEPAPPEACNVLRMAREGLQPVLLDLLRQVRAGARTARAAGVRVRTNGHHILATVALRTVDAAAWAGPPEQDRQPCYLLTLDETGQADAPAESSGAAPAAGGSPTPDAEVRINALLQELDAKEAHLHETREALELANGDLVSSNEELQSINEELQSTNEELETSKEELQSINEELSTVNAELQAKIADLSRTNNDMLNLLAGTGIATIFLDQDLRILRFTPAASRIIHLLPVDTGRPIGDLALDLAGYASLAPDARRVLEARVVVSRDLPGRDGRWYELTLRPYRTTEGEVEGVAITFSDITERKLAEQALRESEQRLRLSTEVAGVAVWKHDLAGNRLERSDNHDGLYGLGQQAARDQDAFLQAIHPDDRERCQRIVRESVAAGGPDRYQFDFRAVWPDRSVHWLLQIGLVTQRDAAGAASEVRGCLMDISAHKAMEERLRQDDKMQAIGQLAGGVAHDFNNQLTGILGFAELLVDGLGEQRLARYAESIRAAALRSADLTKKLLAFSRKGHFRRTPVDVHQIIQETVDLLQRSVDKRIRVVLRLDAGRSRVLGDASQLQNALLNLCLNARDAMPEGGDLTLGTAVAAIDAAGAAGYAGDLAPGVHLLLSMTDTGHGMGDEVRAHLFEPFFTTKAAGKGTGMGLASVFGTVQQHGGAIKADSEEGKGTTFRILLPLLKPEADQPAQPAPAARASARQLRILFVDDEPVIRQIATAMLKTAGHQVAVAADGPEAIAMFRPDPGRYDLVLLDLIMPRMSGRETFRALREIAPQVKVLLVSGFSLNEDTQAVLDEGASGFVQKPFEKRSLFAAIEAVLAREEDPPRG